MVKELITTVNSSLELGFEGVTLEDNSGVLEVKDSLGSPARVKAGDPQNPGEVLVVPSAPTVGYLKIETGASAPSDTSGETIWDRTGINVEGHYRYSSDRGKWLSQDRIYLFYGEDTSTNGFAAPAGVNGSGNYTAYFLKGNYVLTEIHSRSRNLQGANLTKDFELIEVSDQSVVTGPHTMTASSSGEPSFFDKRDFNINLTDPAINIQMVGGVAIRDYAFIIVLHRGE